MAGFTFFKGDASKYKFASEEKEVGHFVGSSYLCYNFMIEKYEDDKIFYEDNNYLVVLDGVILNKCKIISSNGGQTWVQTILSLYQRSDTFFDELRGSFSGVILEKNTGNTIIFSDHIGSKFLYYVQLEDAIFVTSRIADAYSFLKLNNINYELNENGAYMLLSYGYMLENNTLCKGIKKIIPGCYLTIYGTSISETRYCLLDNTPDYSLTEDEAIELIDMEFRKAIALEFEKDKEYGYKHLVALSAGLDSRMTCWVAHEMGYTDQLNITFSQSDYWDETIPKKIASDLKHEWLFKALDNGLWLYDIDDVTKVTGGNVLYYGLAHGNSLYKYLNFKDLGMIHSGQLGDVVVGTFFSSKDSTLKFQLGDGAYSIKYLSNLKGYRLEEYENQEIAKFYHRGFNGANNGQLLEMEYTETCSPFMNWDFMQAILKIPVELRYGHNIYKKWILKKYPDAAKYVWEKIGCRIDRKWGVLEHNGHLYKYSDVIKIIFKKYFHIKIGANNKNMNPISYYLETNKNLNSVLNKKLQQGINEISSSLICDILNSVSKSTDSIEKIQAVSLVEAYLSFFK